MTSSKPRHWLNRLFANRAEQKRVSPFHAVEIRCAKDACQAAHDSHGQRYVSAEAPLLPLGQCDRFDRCQCRYRHYDDRRRDFRRVSDSGLPTQRDPLCVENRHKKPRRSNDGLEEGLPCSVSDDSYYEYMGNTVRQRLLDAAADFDKSK